MNRKAVSGIGLALLLMGISTMAFNIQTIKAEPRTFSDDFGTDTSMWEYLGFAWPPYWGEGVEYTAYRNSTAEYVVLTPNDPHLAGVIWFKWAFTSPFAVNFRYLAGGGTGADGLVMMFYKEKPPVIASGGNLSFFGSGYGVEFDNWYNPEFGEGPGSEPSANHIAIIKDGAYNHLIYANDSRTEDNIWHNVTIIVDNSSIIVYVDSDKVIQWNGTIDRAFGGFGFAGTTGMFTNWHLIDDFSLTISLPRTIDELKTEIEELGSEGEIGNQGIVKSLTAKLNVAQKLVDKGKIDEAKSIFEEDFIPQVQNLTGIHITPEAADILIESAEYILSHL